MIKRFAGISILLAAGLLPAQSANFQIDQILKQYFQVQESLTRDSTKGVDAAARRIEELAASARPKEPGAQELLEEVRRAARGFRGKDLKQTRVQFFELSKPLFSYLHQFYKGRETYYRYFCSMEKKGWVQPDKEVRNPYMGTSMLKCGDLVP